MTELSLFVGAMKVLGIDVGRILESLFILTMLSLFILFLVGKYAWPQLKEFFLDINKLRSAAEEATKDAADMKDNMKDMGQSIQSLNDTLKDYMKNNDEKLIQGNLRFELQANEIKVLAQNHSAILKQIATYAEQVRFLYTRMQIEPPKTDLGDEQQLRDNYPPKE